MPEQRLLRSLAIVKVRGREWDAAAAASALLAATISIARVAGVYPVAVAALAWFGATGWLVVATFRRRLRSWSNWNLVFIAGVGLVVVRLCALGVLQSFGARPGLYWNADGRFFATLAQGISRFGGVSDSLEYAGRPVQYHAGPSWVAGSVHHVVGLPLNFVLFVVVPLLSTILLAFGLHRVLRMIGASGPAALIAAAVVVNLPRSLTVNVPSLLRGQRLIDPEIWLFSSATMLNSVFASAVAATALWAILDRRPSWALIVGCTPVACLLILKPQYMPVAALLAGALFVAARWVGLRNLPWRAGCIASAWVGVFLAGLAVLNPQIITFDGIVFAPGDALEVLSPISQGLAITSSTAVVLMAMIPTLARRQPHRLAPAALAVAGGAVLILVGVHGTVLLLDSGLVERAQAIGLAIGRAWQDGNFDQAVDLAAVFVALFAIAQLVDFLRRVRSLPARVVELLVALVPLCLSVPMAYSVLRYPTGPAGYEWTEEASLRSLIDGVDTTSGLWLSSDLADSAEGFRRPLRAVHVTALSDAQFYLSNVTYNGWAQPDVADRLGSVQRFFETPWSAWHESFLRSLDIRHVLIRDRCPPNWASSDFSGAVVGRGGDWTLLGVGRRERSAAVPSWPAYSSRPGYGVSPCLAYPTDTKSVVTLEKAESVCSGGRCPGDGALGSSGSNLDGDGS